MSDAEVHTTTKKELVNRIADRTGQTKVVVKEIIQEFLDDIINELSEGNRLEFREFGVFEVKERAARRAQNPRTLEKVDVPAKRVVKFKVGRLMRERVRENPAPPKRGAAAAGELSPGAAPGATSAAEEPRRRPGGSEPAPPPPPRSNSPFWRL